MSEPLLKAYRLGGFGLAFLVLGAIFLAASAAAPRGTLSYVVAGVGLLLIAVPCYFFYVKEIRPLASAQDKVRQKSELIDSVQDTAMEMTLAAYDLQSLALANAQQIAEFIRVTRPIISRIPVFGRIAESSQLERAEWLTTSVVTATERSEHVINDVRQALTEADAARLKAYLSELRRLRNDLKELLRKVPQPSPPA